MIMFFTNVFSFLFLLNGSFGSFFVERRVPFLLCRGVSSSEESINVSFRGRPKHFSSRRLPLNLFFNSNQPIDLLSSRTNLCRNMSSSNDEVAAAKAAAAAYESSDKDGAGPATVFDKILSKEWSSKAVYEDDLAYAFRDISPQAPTHILVIPKKRDGLVKLSNAREDQKDILGHLLYVAQKIGKEECPDGFRIAINDGEQGAQSVYHLHLHILGGRQMNWPPG